MTSAADDRVFKRANPIKRLLRALRPAKPDHRGALLARLPKAARGAEIGVWKGDFSTRLLQIAEPGELYLAHFLGAGGAGR